MYFQIVMTVFFLVFGIPIAASSQDKSESTVQRNAHKQLVETFVKDKKCVYSPDKSKIQEVVIYDQDTKVVKEKRIELPENTEQVSGFFDQLVIRGKNLKKVKASLQLRSEKNELKIIAAPSDEELVLRMTAFPLSEILRIRRLGAKADSRSKKADVTKREKQSVDPVLYVECSGEIQIHQISLRTTKDLFLDFDTWRKSLLKFPSDKIGKLAQEFHLSTLDQNFTELSESLSVPSEAFHRLVDIRTRAAAGNATYPLRGVVSDPRVAKLYQALLQMKENEAAEVSAAIFDRALLEFQASWKTAGALPNSSVYSVNAHLFLCSEFCPASVVLNKMDTWEAWHAERAAIPSQLQFRHTAGLEQIYSMNLLMNVIRRDRGLTIEGLNALVADKLGPSLFGPPHPTNPKYGRGGAKPPTLKMLEFATSGSDSQGRVLLTRIPHVEPGSLALGNPIRKEALMGILRKEVLGDLDQSP